VPRRNRSGVLNLVRADHFLDSRDAEPRGHESRLALLGPGSSPVARQASTGWLEIP
jgi:hypothetical protein